MGRLKTNRERRRKKMGQVPKGNKPLMQGGVVAPGLLPGVKPNDLTEVSCKRCEGKLFLTANNLRHASVFQTAVGQPMLIEFRNCWVCLQCGARNEFTIPGVTDKEEKKEETSG